MAKRLCDLAGPGVIHIGPQAFELVGARFAFADPVRAHLKGRSGDVLFHRVAERGKRTLVMAG
jgi:class 3 adenylate cyclase